MQISILTLPDRLFEDALDLYERTIDEPGSLTEEGKLTMPDQVPMAVVDE